MTNGFDVTFGMSIDQCGPARELRQLAHERARTVGHDMRAMLGPVPLRDLDVARSI